MIALCFVLLLTYSAPASAVSGKISNPSVSPVPMPPDLKEFLSRPRTPEQEEMAARAEQHLRDILQKEQAQKEKMIIFLALSAFFIFLCLFCLGRFALIQYKNSKDFTISHGSLASPGYRIGAFLIDIFLITLIALPLLWSLGAPPHYGEKEFDPAFRSLWILAAWLYFSVMESSKYEATVGKLAFGLIVADGQGKRLTFGRALLRSFLKLLAPFSGPGFLLSLLTKKKQAMHDVLANTLVLFKSGKT